MAAVLFALETRTFGGDLGGGRGGGGVPGSGWGLQPFLSKILSFFPHPEEFYFAPPARVSITCKFIVVDDHVCERSRVSMPRNISDLWLLSVHMLIY